MFGTGLQQKELPSGDVCSRLISEFERGIALITRLNDEEFSRSADGHSSVGAHIRHCIDFANSLLNGLAERRVDYNHRARDPRVEMDRQYAAEQISFACRRLESLTGRLMSAMVMVRSEIDGDTWHASSVSREIEFLHGHIIHHFALINLLVPGGNACADFGIAPSTLRYRAGEADVFANRF